MALSSQTRRSAIGVRTSGGSRGRSSRTKRARQRRARRVFGLVVFVGAVGLGWWALGTPGIGSRAGAPGEDLTAAAPGGAELASESRGAEERAALPEGRGREDRVERTLADADGEPAGSAAGTIAATPEEDTAPVFRMGSPLPNRGERESGRPGETDLGSQIRHAAARERTASAPAGNTEVLSDPPDESGAAPARTLASPPAVKERIEWGREAIEQNRLVDARRLLTEALVDQRCAPADQPYLRETLTGINEQLLFSPTIASDDPLVSRYVIESGDALSRIARKTGADVDWRFIQRINRISDPRRIRVGQTLKIVKGPFHAVVDKSDYRMDVYAAVPTSEGGGTVYVRSFPVGLGELDSTPTGEWVVRDASKLVNPDWTNPRTGERFDKNDPENPIGERWIGLRGTSPETEALSGYGIHGTIEPNSIGQQRSMGCVRLLDDDVEMVYEMLSEGTSRVAIVE